MEGGVQLAGASRLANLPFHEVAEPVVEVKARVEARGAPFADQRVGLCDVLLAGGGLGLNPLYALERVAGEVVVLFVAPASVSALALAFEVGKLGAPAVELDPALLAAGVQEVGLLP